MCQEDLIDSDNHSRCCKHRPSGSQESPIQTVLGFLVCAGCWSPRWVGGSTQAELAPGARRRLAAPWYPSPAGDGQTRSIPPGWQRPERYRDLGTYGDFPSNVFTDFWGGITWPKVKFSEIGIASPIRVSQQLCCVMCCKANCPGHSSYF